VCEFIKQYGNIGTIDEPDEYVQDTLPLTWTPGVLPKRPGPRQKADTGGAPTGSPAALHTGQPRAT
jgi:hypothetical protein